MESYLVNRINSKTSKIGVVGLGYVGLPLAIQSAKKGFSTVGFDISKEKIKKLQTGNNYILDVDNSELKKLINTKYFQATTDFGMIAEMDVVLTCVPSPLDKHAQPDMTYIKSAAGLIGKNLSSNTLVVLESTTFPGTTEEVVKPILEKASNLICNKDFFLGFSPERIDPGNKTYKVHNTPKVVGGTSPEATSVMETVYQSILDNKIFKVSSPAVAEMEKILENTYRNINIGLVNELAILCHHMNINIWEVIEAAKSKPYGFQAFYPGPGLGGHCIPLDPAYLSWKAKEYSFHTSMIENSTTINDKMPQYCVSRIQELLNNSKKPLNGTKILVLGVAYKPDIDDYRESPALKIIDLLLKNGCEVDYYDPYIPELKNNSYKLISIPDANPEVIAKYDLVTILTAHTNIDYAMICKNSKLIFDARGATRKLTRHDNIELL